MEKRHGENDRQNQRSHGKFRINRAFSILLFFFLQGSLSAVIAGTAPRHDAFGIILETNSDYLESYLRITDCSDTSDFTCGENIASSSYYSYDGGMVKSSETAYSVHSCDDTASKKIICGWSECDKEIASAMRSCNETVGVCDGKTWKSPIGDTHVLCPIAFDLVNGSTWILDTKWKPGVIGSQKQEVKCNNATVNRIEGYCSGDKCDEGDAEKLLQECNYSIEFGVSTTPNTSADKKSEGPSTGMIVCIVLGVVAVVAVLGFIIIYRCKLLCFKKKPEKPKERKVTDSMRTASCALKDGVNISQNIDYYSGRESAAGASPPSASDKTTPADKAPSDKASENK